MEYADAKYIANPITNENCGISVLKSGNPVIVPLDPANTDYANLMELEREGKIVIQPADGEQQ